jgi:hypothetical protein
VILTPDMFAGRTTFLVGAEKHAGKTTLLNYVIRMVRQARVPLAYMSVGVDGEVSDALSGARKPHVIAAAGDWIVTAEKAIDQGDLAVEVHEVLAPKTIMGRTIVARVIRGGAVELIGPGTNAQTAEILDVLANQIGVTTALVDGSIDRITQVSAASSSAGFVYVLRVGRANLTRALDLIRRMELLQAVPIATETCNATVIDGAVTAERIATLPADSQTVVVHDVSRVFLTLAELPALSRRVRLSFRRKHECIAYVVNLFDIAPNELLDRLNDSAAARRIVFNPYQQREAA